MTDTNTAQPALREYLQIARYRKWSIAAITLLCVATALILSFRQTPIYAAEAHVVVKPIASGGGEADEPNMSTEQRLAGSTSVAQVVAGALPEDLGEVPVSELSASVSVDNPVNTEILVFGYSSTDPETAATVAQAFADGYLDYRSQQATADLLAATETTQEQIDELNDRLGQLNAEAARADTRAQRLSLQAQANSLAGRIAILEQRLTDVTPSPEVSSGEVIQPAEVPTRPVSPNHVVNGGLAFAVGLGLGVAFALLRERMADRFRTSDDVARVVEAPVLGVIPRVDDWKKSAEPVVTIRTHPHSPAAEAFRTLRAGVSFIAATEGLKTILVTSAEAGEGKSATSANLAVALAEAGRKVVVVSADLRRPRLHSFFDVADAVGTTTVLAGEVELREALVNVGVDNLRLMPSGKIPGNPAELLSSDKMRRVLHDLERQSDYVLLDAPPVLAVAEPLSLARFADGVIVVVDARTSPDAVAHACRQLNQVGARIIGAVLNNFDWKTARGPGYYPPARYIEYAPGAEVTPLTRSEG